MELRSLGKYRLAEPLPTKSAGCEFYLVQHEDEPEQGRPSYVAKLLKPDRSPDAKHRLARFEHEVRLLKSFNHPSIPTLHAAGEQDGIAYIVMDRVDGVDLATLLGHHQGQPRALSKEIAVYVLGQITDAFRHIHTLEFLEAGEPTPLDVVHRNVTPANILVSVAGDVVLSGFGQAYSRWLPAEHDDPMLGDLAYMAPERLTNSGPPKETADIFSLAIVLWEMLRGQRCLAGSDDAQTREHVMRFDIGQAQRRVPGLSAKLSEILRRNLDRDPSRRYSGAYKLLQRLAQAPEAGSAERARAGLGELARNAQ